MRFIVGLVALGIILTSSLALAGDDSLASRVAALENSMEERWFDKVQFSGAVEVEAAYSDAGGETSSNVDLATFDLGVDVELSNLYSGFAVMTWNGDDNVIEIDEAGIVLGNVDEMGFAVTAGRLYVPFGVFETSMLADPLTLELGETNEGAIVADFGIEGAYASAYAFNSEDDIEGYGATAGYALESDAFSLDVSAGYISDLAVSLGHADGKTGAATFAAVVGVADLTFVAEYMAALDSDYSDASNDEPSAWYVEAAYGFDISGHGSSVAVTYQESDEADGVLVETRYGAAFGYEVIEGLGATVEYLRDEDYDDSEVDSVVLQLALEF